ncbi:hypothetical protein D910_11401 [Dendroctonus ponderosae]|uniref:HTH OST-type domain-containing protein n=1 Tax=Dendroctonus ponderosae TaxID=77166 RepID=U4UJ68_DENPD|nr:hypothetical protein D910_11401 [Dendroctonus ponderosae]
MATTKEELEVKNSIKALLTSSPCVSTISSLQKEYADLIGEPIPYKKLGYNGLEHLLKSIKDVCIVRGCGWYAEVYPVVTEDIAHINEMVTRQKVTPKNRKFAMPRRRFSTPVPVSNRSPFAYQNSPINTTPNSRSTVKENMVNNASGVCATNTATTTIRTHGLTANTGATTPSSTPQRSNCQRNLSHINENPSRLIEFKTTLTRNSNLQVDQLKSNVEKDSGHAVQHSPQNSINRDDAQSSHMSFQAVKETFEEDISNVPQKVQDNLKTLIAQYPDGIWASDLPTAYMKLFKRVLFYKDYGYVNLVDMCIALKHIFHYIRPGLDDFKLFDKSKPFPESAEKYWTISSSGQAAKKPSHIEPLPDLDWSDFKDRLPSDIFPYGQIIPNQFLPKSTRVGDVFDAVVVEVYDPSKFWFYLGNSVNKTPLDDLMDQLQYFYNDSTNAQEYAVPRAVIKEGLYCVQIIIGEYHRAKVIRVLPQEDCVRLFFIDYGSISKVPMKGLCFLRSEFAALPAQGIRCRLANIAPVTKGITWCRTAVNTFRDMINRKDTKIKISYIDWQEEFVCVFLADVTELNNVHYVNEKLVKEGIAVWCEESSNQESSMKNTAASRSLSLASLVSSESDYKEFVPRSARICGDDSSPTALVQYKTQMPEIELCDRINQVEIAPIVDQAISLGESTEISSNETIDSCNYPLNASLNYLAQMLESASRTSRSQGTVQWPLINSGNENLSLSSESLPKFYTHFIMNASDDLSCEIENEAFNVVRFLENHERNARFVVGTRSGAMDERYST